MKTDLTKSEKVAKAIEKKISPAALRRAYRAYLTAEKGKEMDVLRYVFLGFKLGRDVDRLHGSETVRRIDVLNHKVSWEADRILGMGDVVSLVEKAQEQYDEKQARELKKKLAKDQFTLWDFYQQIQQVKKMGNVKDLAAMIPGVGKALKDVDIPDDAFKSTEAIILSMTPYEREHPEAINGSRRKRIADGSGTSVPEVNKLLKQFEGTRKLMKGAVTGSLMQQMRNFRR